MRRRPGVVERPAPRRPSPAGRTPPSQRPSSACSASSRAPQPSVATRARSAAIVRVRSIGEIPQHLPPDRRVGIAGDTAITSMPSTVLAASDRRNTTCPGGSRTGRMNPWTGRPPKTRCPAHRSRRPTRACCWAVRPRPARGATATPSATAGSPASARSAPRAAASFPAIRLAYETWGELSPARDNAVLMLHALTGDSHVRGAAGPGHPTEGWWDEIVGPGRRDRHRPLVRDRAEHARRLPGLDRSRRASRRTATSGPRASRT